MCAGDTNCASCAAGNCGVTTARTPGSGVQMSAAGNVIPNQEQLREAFPLIQNIVAANPNGVAAILNANGFGTQGIANSSLGGYVYKLYAAGQFDIGLLDGLRIASINNDGSMTSADTSARIGTKSGDMFTGDWQDIVGDVGGVLGCFFGGNCGQNQPTQTDNSGELIAGMQKTTVYMIAGIMVVVIALIIFLALKKK
ncbi:MAG TPA: hypothetical protein PKU77_07645 [Ferruginibacter sp.]|nr:hypothetical protein [Ferruginibacter sp.]